ncbi:MAG: glycosyltransferase [Chlamydiia bacterium]|nr:glycosyltransferase [Chlamydiia bacterium]
MRKVAFFAPVRSQYGVLPHFTEKLAEAFLRAGVSCRTFTGGKEDQKRLIAELVDDAPDFTVAFNGLLPDEEGRFLCDHLEIPHVAWLVDSPQHFFPLAKSPLTLVGCDDRINCQLFKELGASQTLFLPHAIERDALLLHEQDRPYDVVFLGSLYDPNVIRAEWQARFSKEQGKAIEQAAERLLAEEGLPASRALIEELERQGISCASSDFIEMMDLTERYMRGKDRCDLLRSIRRPITHIFGDAVVGESWSKVFGDTSNLRMHPPLSYQQALETMRKSKVVLNSCPRIRHGGHERICAGLASGALVLTQANPFLRKAFTQGRDIAFYEHKALSGVDDQICHYLEHEEARRALAEAGQANVKAGHTYDVRVREILEHMTAWRTALGLT